jgi:hypothetical protein
MFIPTYLLHYYTVSACNFIAVYAAVFPAFKRLTGFFMQPSRAIAAASLASPLLPQSSDNAMMQAV